jgi:hypothetical protein
MISKQTIEYLIYNPEELLKEAVLNNRNLTEEDWGLIHQEIASRKLNNRLKDSLLISRNASGVNKFKAIGQLFARYARVGKGFAYL